MSVICGATSERTTSLSGYRSATASPRPPGPQASSSTRSPLDIAAAPMSDSVRSVPRSSTNSAFRAQPGATPSHIECKPALSPSRFGAVCVCCPLSTIKSPCRSSNWLLAKSNEFIARLANHGKGCSHLREEAPLPLPAPQGAGRGDAQRDPGRRRAALHPGRLRRHLDGGDREGSRRGPEDGLRLLRDEE